MEHRLVERDILVAGDGREQKGVVPVWVVREMSPLRVSVTEAIRPDLCLTKNAFCFVEQSR